jgi:NAD(P)-dependent dehydrogenase (short-subunit alcohol dehydrogenase family)
MKPVAIITGASQGLGLELAKALAARGFALAIDARRADRLAAAEAQLAALTEVAAVPGDVTADDHRRELVAAAADLGPIAVVVNNASTLGASPLPNLDEIDAGTLRETFETNVVAPIALYQLALPHLHEGGVIVNITSDAAVEGYPGWGGYGVTKAALEHAGRVLAAEREDLRVLTIDPGDMRTEMHQDAFPGEDIGDRPLPEVSVPGIVALIEGDQPSGRYVAREIGR